MADDHPLLWTPSADRVAHSRLNHFMQWLATEHFLYFSDYQSLWEWSVDDLERFWSLVWIYFDIKSSAPYQEILSTHAMPGAEWFTGSRLNFAEQLFRFNTEGASADKVAVVAESEVRERVTLSWGQVREQITAVAQALRGMGVVPGDRVVAYLPIHPKRRSLFTHVRALARSGPPARPTWAVPACWIASARLIPRF